MGNPTALAVGPDGYVYVGGQLWLDQVPDVSVARWDGTSWTALGDLYMDVRALALLPDGRLIAGARATIGDSTYSLMHWDGQTWMPMGRPSESYVTELAVSSQGQIAAVGIFPLEPPQPPGNVAVWSGEAWMPLGTGAWPTAHTLAWLPDGRLALGGEFESVSGVSATNVAVWDGTSWSADGGPVRGGVFESSVHRLRVHDGALFAGGSFSVAGSRATFSLARRTADGWAAYGSAADGPILQWLPDGMGGVYARGRFDTVADVVTAGIARWSGSSWEGLPDGGPAPVSAIALDASGTLVAAGWRPEWLGTGAMRLGPSGWEPLGTPFLGHVEALARTPQGELYAGGSIYDYDTELHALARWNGHAWAPVPDVPLWVITQLLPLADGDLIATGSTSDPAWRVARWNGSAWAPMGAGLNHTPSALFQRGDGSLLAATVAGVHRWTGTAWHLLFGQPLATALTEDEDGELVVGVESSGGYPARLFRSQAGVWPELATLNGPAHALHPVGGGHLLVGGWFTSAGGVHSPFVTRYVPGGVSTETGPEVAGAALAVARTHATIRIGDAHGAATLAVYDLLGRRVATVFENASAPREATLSVAALPSGVYVVRLTTADGVRQSRLVVAR
jgi:hypothetical protein